MKTFLFIALLVLQAEAFAASPYEAAIDQEISKGLAHEAQWLRLGHWKRRGAIRRIFRSEYRSEADGTDFFLSPLGKNDPAEELRATLRGFAIPLAETKDKSELSHAQCMFPARFRWAVNKLKWDKILTENGLPVLPCEARKAWKRTLDAEGVSLVFASAYLNNAASMFGHTFLKFHSRANKDGRDLLDYGVSLAAETGSDGGVPFAIFGLTGVYPGRFTMQPFHQTLRTYANIEGRDLIEYRLAFTPDEIDFFIDHLFELERTYFDYYFLTENCSYFLFTAIDAAKPGVDLSEQFWYEVIPADSVRVAARTPGLVTGIKHRPSLMAVFRAQAANLSYADIQFAKDVIDNGKTTGWKEASTPALDLALDYGGVRATGSTKYDVTNHLLRAERASRGGASPMTKLETPKRPEEGHDPARVGFIYELPTEYEGARGRLGLQFRFAYHDRLSNDDGYLRGTTLEVLRMTAMNEEKDPSQIRLREIAIMEILSAQPRDRFEQPVSWRVSFGVREPLGARSLGPYFNGGAGTTLAFGKWLWVSGLLNGEALTNPDVAGTLPLHAGPRVIATAFLSPKLKLGFDYGLMRAVTPGRHYDFMQTEASWAPLRNLEIRIGHNQTSIEGVRRSEWSAKLYQHLLF